MPDQTKEQRSTARYQIDRSAVEAFVAMHAVYRALEPALREHADRLMEIMNGAETTEDEWNLSLHTIIEILLGE